MRESMRELKQKGANRQKRARNTMSKIHGKVNDYVGGQQDFWKGVELDTAAPPESEEDTEEDGEVEESEPGSDSDGDA